MKPKQFVASLLQQIRQLFLCHPAEKKKWILFSRTDTQRFDQFSFAQNRSHF